MLIQGDFGSKHRHCTNMVEVRAPLKWRQNISVVLWWWVFLLAVISPQGSIMLIITCPKIWNRMYNVLHPGRYMSARKKVFTFHFLQTIRYPLDLDLNIFLVFSIIRLVAFWENKVYLMFSVISPLLWVKSTSKEIQIDQETIYFAGDTLMCFYLCHGLFLSLHRDFWGYAFAGVNRGHSHIHFVFFFVT